MADTPSAPPSSPSGAPRLPGSLAGQILIAMPAMVDSRFVRSVIYICDHGAKGAMGLVLNHALTRPSFEDLLRQLDIQPRPPARTIRLCEGGPMENARGFVLHSTDWTGEDSLRVNDSYALTANLEILKAIAGGGGPKQGVLALGYAGWGPGQLEGEVRENAWLTAPATPELVFDAEIGTKWRRALAGLGIDPVALSGAAGHA